MMSPSMAHSSHFLRVLCKHADKVLGHFGRTWGRRLTAELEQCALYGVALPKQGLQMRQHIDNTNIERLESLF